MLGSLALMVPLVLFLRGRGQRSTSSQASVISVLIHVMISCAQLRDGHPAGGRYVKQESGVDLSLSVPRSVELALHCAIRAAAKARRPPPADLTPAATVVQRPHEPAAVPVDVPLDSAVSGRGSAAALPALAAGVGRGRRRLLSLPPPDVAQINVPLPQPVHQNEAEPRATLIGWAKATDAIRPADTGDPAAEAGRFDDFHRSRESLGSSGFDCGGGAATAAGGEPPPLVAAPPMLIKPNSAPASPLLGGADHGDGSDAERGRSGDEGGGSAREFAFAGDFRAKGIARQRGRRRGHARR